MRRKSRGPFKRCATLSTTRTTEMKTAKPKFNFGDPHKVKSTQVDSFRYDSAARVLSVTFKGGGEYHYSDVPQGTVDGFKKAESAGNRVFSPMRITSWLPSCSTSISLDSIWLLSC